MRGEFSRLTFVASSTKDERDNRAAITARIFSGFWNGGADLIVSRRQSAEFILFC